MATSGLVRALREDGSKLIAELDRQQVKVGTAFWHYDGETDEWRLVLSMPLVDELGAAAAQGRIGGALNAVGTEHLLLWQVIVVSPRDSLVLSISRAVYTKARALSGIHVSRSASGGEWIEDAYVYRST